MFALSCGISLERVSSGWTSSIQLRVLSILQEGFS